MKKILSLMLIFCLTACLAVLCPFRVSAEEYIPELGDTEIYSKFNEADLKNYIVVDGYIYDYAENYFFAAQLYDAENKLIAEKKSVCDDYMVRISFFGLSDEAATYTVTYWLEDEAGNLISPVGTQECKTKQVPESFYGIISSMGIRAEGFETYYEVEMLDAAGKETIYKCANKVYVNGVRYSAKEVLNGALPVGVHTQFIVNDIGKIYIIVFDETAEIYEKVSYNAKTKSFTGVMLESGIPVYYQGGVSPAYLDENHLYNLEVYDYGINITDYHAKNNKETIWDIDFSSGFDADFKQHIDVFCNTAADSFLVGQLYSGENQLVQEQTGTDGEGLIFSDLPNETAEYTIKLWLEDAEGNMLSYVYILPYKTEKSTVFYAQAAVSAISNGAFGEDVLQIKMIGAAGTGTVFDCADAVKVNDNVYTDAEALQEAIPLGSVVKFACRADDGRIVRIQIISEATSGESIGLCGENFIWRLDAEGLMTITGEKALGEYNPLGFYVAGYGRDENLLFAKKIMPKEKNGVLYAETEIDTEQIEQADSISIFVWESFASMKPLYGKAYILY